MATTKLMQIRVPEQDVEAVQKIARKRGLTVSDLMRRLINSALRKGVLKSV